VTTYTPSSKLAEVIERLSYVIEESTPTLAASVLFVRHTDTTCKLEHLTDPEGRIRRFEIRSETPSYGLLAWGVNVASLARVLRIRVGYPACDYYPELRQVLRSHSKKVIAGVNEDRIGRTASDRDSLV